MKDNKIMQQYEGNNSWESSDGAQITVNNVINEVFSLAHDIRIAWGNSKEKNDLTFLIKLNDRLIAVQLKLIKYPLLHETVSAALNKQVKLMPSTVEIKAQHRLFSLGLIVDHMLFNCYTNLFAEINKQINELAQLVVRKNIDQVKLYHINSLSENLSPLIYQMQNIINNIPKKLLPIDFVKQLTNVENNAVNPQTVPDSLQDMNHKLEQAKAIIPTLKGQYHLLAESKRQQSNQNMPVNNSHSQNVNGASQLTKRDSEILKTQSLSQPVISNNNVKHALNLTDVDSTHSNQQKKTSKFTMGDKTGFAKRIKDIRKELNEVLRQRDDVLLSLEQEIGQKNYSISLNELRAKHLHHLIAIEAALKVISKEWKQYQQNNAVTKDNKNYIENLISAVKLKDIEDAKQIINSNQSKEQMLLKSRDLQKASPANCKGVGGL